MDSLRPRHEASKREPTVHGSWPNEFLFYKPRAHEKKGVRVQHSATALGFEGKGKHVAYPVKARGTLSHVDLSPSWRNEDVAENDRRWEGHKIPPVGEIAR